MVPPNNNWNKIRPVKTSGTASEASDPWGLHHELRWHGQIGINCHQCVSLSEASQLYQLWHVVSDQNNVFFTTNHWRLQQGGTLNFIRPNWGQFIVGFTAWFTVWNRYRTRNDVRKNDPFIKPQTIFSNPCKSPFKSTNAMKFLFAALNPPFFPPQNNVQVTPQPSAGRSTGHGHVAHGPSPWDLVLVMRLFRR